MLFYLSSFYTTLDVSKSNTLILLTPGPRLYGSEELPTRPYLVADQMLFIQ